MYMFRTFFYVLPTHCPYVIPGVVPLVLRVVLHFPQVSPHTYPSQNGYSEGQMCFVSCKTPSCPQHNGFPGSCPLSATHFIFGWLHE